MVNLIAGVGATGMVVGALLALWALHLIAHAVKSDVDRMFGDKPSDRAVYGRPSREPDQTKTSTKPL